MENIDNQTVGSEDVRSESAVALKSDDSKDRKAGSPKTWKGRIERSKRIRKDLLPDWADNVDFRRGKPFKAQSDSDRVNVNLDWSLTKGKHAQLFSQTPKVYLTPKDKAFAPAVPVFGKRLNDRLTDAKVGAACDEAVLDAINASGVGIAMVSYQAKTEQQMIPDKETPGMSPEEIQMAVQAGMIKMVPSTKTLDVKFAVERLSPSDFLWPDEFTGSDFDNAPWLGRSGTMLWDEGVVEFGLTEDQKEEACGTKAIRENLRLDIDNVENTEQVIEFDEIFYWAYKFDSAEKYYKKIRRIVFVKGIDEPVKDEEWAGQVFDEAQGSYVGACKFPLRVLTLTYISDDAIPPSDTAVGRPQVNEMVRSRTQLILQRDRSIPVRWMDINRVDPAVQDTLMRGTFQGFIPLQGDGSRSVGEVARANYPKEDYEFDRIIKQDLQEQWQVGSNQLGSFASGERSASEANIVQQNFQSRIGYERSRVAAFFVGIAEVMAGLMAVYDTFPLMAPEDMNRIDTTWDRKRINGEFVFYIRPDSTVLLDANQRVDKLMKLLNLVGKSGFVNPEPIITEIVALNGLDPIDVMTKPQPPAPDLPNIAYSFKGEDMQNPIVIALMMKSGQMASPEDLQAAKNLLAKLTDPTPMEGAVAPPAIDPAQQMGDTRPGWTPPARVTKRVDEMGG